MSAKETELLEVMVVKDGSPVGALHFDSRRLRRLVTIEPRVISIHRDSEPERERVERYIEDTYGEAYAGRIRRHYPTLMSVQDVHGVIHAAVGFRLAAEAPLFLERYLDAPIERVLAEAAGLVTPRTAVAEIGNLASRSNGASLFLFCALAQHLGDLGCQYAAATATRQLRRSFRRAGFQTWRLASADPSRLGAEAQEWGGYYQQAPEVLAGAIVPAMLPLSDQLLAQPPNIEQPQAWLHAEIGAAQ